MPRRFENPNPNPKRRAPNVHFSNNGIKNNTVMDDAWLKKLLKVLFATADIFRSNVYKKKFG